MEREGKQFLAEGTSFNGAAPARARNDLSAPISAAANNCFNGAAPARARNAC